MDDPVDDAARIVSAVRAALPAAVRPWEISARRHRGDAGVWAVSLAHEASPGLVFEPRLVDADATIAAVRALIPHQYRELERVGHAPALSHPDLVMEIRALARIFDWTRVEVTAVVRLVANRLSPDEVEWLTSWVGRDEQPRPMSLDG